MIVSLQKIVGTPISNLEKKNIIWRVIKMDRSKELITTIENCRKAMKESIGNLEGAINDVYNLLKPRVLTLEEVLEWKDSVWVEEKNGTVFLALIKRIFDDRKVIALFDCSEYYTTSSYEYDDYNKIQRFWTAKPTPEQQELTKWDE